MKTPVHFQQHVIFILALFLMIFICFKGEEPVAQQEPVGEEQPAAEAQSPEQLESKAAMMEEVSCETCHGTLEEVAANTTPTYPEGVNTEAARAALVTQVFPINPHKSHYGEMKCTQCHKEGETTLYCNTCHDFSRVQFTNTMVTVSDKSCLKCHESYEKMAKEITKRFPTHVKTEIQKASNVTQVYPFNPHKSHYEEMKCTQCHKIHGESKFYCNTCHNFGDIDVP